MAQKIGSRLIAAFAITLILLIGNGIMSYRSINTLMANNAKVNHTQDVMGELASLRLALLQIETDARGFLLTGDNIYQDAYKNGIAHLPERIEQLKSLTADNQSHQQKFIPLENAIRSRLDLLQEYVDRKQVLGATVIPAGQSGEGKRRMDAVRNAIDDIARDEEALFHSRVEESRLSGQRTIFTFLIANVVLLALLVLVFYMAARDIRERALSENRLREAHDLLEERVRQRTVELNEANLELERSNRELQDFAFVASHDLQEPLRKIQAFGDRLQTVQADKFDERGRDYLNRMHNAAGRMHTLINDLLSYSRVTTKAQPFRRVDLNKTATEVLSDLETRIDESGGTVEIQDLPVIDADEIQMRQLFQNLIANALKFRKPDAPPVVTLDSELITGPNGDPPIVKISVTDNGIGFDEKYLDRIFTPFQRLHGRNEYEGTGIGLAVCRRIAERHGGTLTAKSKEGTGSIFIVTLPVNQLKEK